MRTDEPAWADLADPDDRRAWARVEKDLRFRPSIHPADWPVFAEPRGSVTWSLAPVRPVGADDGPHRRYAIAVQQALLAGGPEVEPYFALCWQHPGLLFWPSRLHHPADPASWLLPAYPNGDYVLYLTRDHSAGLLANPWEESVCVYGDGLVAAFTAAVGPLLGAPLRHGGAGAAR